MRQLSTTARVLHDLGLAAGFGGSLFSQLALNPAVRAIANERDRGRVVHDAWDSYKLVHAAALATMTASWVIGRALFPGRGLRRNVRALTVAKDAVLGGAIASGIACWLAGRLLAKESDGAGSEIPMIAGGRASIHTPARARKLQRLVNVLSTANILIGAAAIGVSAVLGVKSGKPAHLALLNRMRA